MLVRVRLPAKRLDGAATTGPPRGMSLLARVLVLNGAVIVGAFLLVALTPLTVSARVTGVEGLALGLIIAGALAAERRRLDAGRPDVQDARTARPGTHFAAPAAPPAAAHTSRAPATRQTHPPPLAG
jgi:hypothetical protein